MADPVKFFFSRAVLNCGCFDSLRVISESDFMERIIRSPVLLLIFLFMSLSSGISCSGHYLRNRADDAADIFTEVTTGSYRLAIQAGPVSIGAHYKSPGKACGLRGGFFGCYETASFTALFFGTDYFGAEPFENKLKSAAENKTEEEVTSESEDISPLDLRKKSIYAKSPFGTISHLHRETPLIQKPTLEFRRERKKRFAPAYHYTRLELIIGLYFGLRLGINIGELADFLVGIAGFDLYGDDRPYEPETDTRSYKEHPLFDYLPEETQKMILENE